MSLSLIDVDVITAYPVNRTHAAIPTYKPFLFALFVSNPSKNMPAMPPEKIA